MGLNIGHFLVGMVVLSLAAIFLLQPHHVTIVEKKGIPQVAFFDFHTYEITPKGVEAYLKGQRAQRYTRKTIVDEPVLRRVGERGEETVRAGRGIFEEGVGIELKKEVILSRSDGWRMETDRLHYDLLKKVYSNGEAPFRITFGKSVVTGKRLRYETKTGKIRAVSIRAKIAEEDM